MEQSKQIIMEDSQNLGDVTLYFNKKDGRYIGSTLRGCKLDSFPIVQDLRSSKNEQDLCKLAELVLADVFTMVNKIELADRERFKIRSTPKDVKRNDKGLITDITISFSLEEIKV